MAPLKEAERREFKAIMKRLEKIRKELDWPQARIAKLCGVTQATYSRWGDGKSEPESLALIGLKSRVPQVIAELKANQMKIERILKEIESLREGGGR